MDQGPKVKIPDSCLNSSMCEFTRDERHTLFQFPAFQQVYQSSPAPAKHHSSFTAGELLDSSSCTSAEHYLLSILQEHRSNI